MKTAAHASQRALHKKLPGNDWIVEMAPFMHRITKTSFEAGDTPWAHVTNIKAEFSGKKVRVFMMGDYEFLYSIKWLYWCKW